LELRKLSFKEKQIDLTKISTPFDDQGKMDFVNQNSRSERGFLMVFQKCQKIFSG